MTGVEDRDRQPVSERSVAAWRTWLRALAVDADAALSAALIYEALAREARVAWLDALDADLVQSGVPAVAAYAPLLAVEEDPELRARIEERLGGAPTPEDEDSAGISVLARRRAWSGACGRGAHLVVVSSPLYLHFVELLICRVAGDETLLGTSIEPLWDGRNLRRTLDIEGVTVAEVPMHDAVDVLAHAVLAERRAGRAAPEDLVRFADLFGQG